MEKKLNGKSSYGIKGKLCMCRTSSGERVHVKVLAICASIAST